MIYVAVTPYSNGYTRYFKVNEIGLKRLHDSIMDFADDILLATDIEIWAETASVGETFENRYFEIEIIED